MPVRQFPKNFLWGAAASAHQVEGNTHNDWTEWEIKNAQRLADEARKRHGNNPSWRFSEAFFSENYVSGKACDHYTRFEEDFDLAKSLGHNAHRFSIEWSRIEPEEGIFDEKEIEHYRKVLEALHGRGMTPFVTLWHWTNPVWVSKKGGWGNKNTVEYFLRYVGKIADSLGEDITHWITVNEPAVYVSFAYLVGQFPPGFKNPLWAWRVLHNLFRAHARAYNLIHKKLPSRAHVGVAYNLHLYVPARPLSLMDRAAMALVTYISDTWQLRLAGDAQDFIGLNYYFRDTLQFVFGGGRYGVIDVRNPNRDVSDIGWDISPEGIYHVLRSLKKYRKPIYITENGIADTRDEKRAAFITNHLRWVHRAMQEGVDVRGYFYWSLLDNFEWDKGFWPRFGLFAVDYKTLERKKRPSADVYAEIARTNSLPS